MDLNRNTILSKQVAPGTYSYNVHSIDNDIPFGQLSPGTYYYQIEAKDASQNFQVLYYDQFVVYNDIGTDFLGTFLNTAAWKEIRNTNGNAEIAAVASGKSDIIWKFIRNSDGSYTILSALDGKALDADNFGTVDGTNVQCYTQNGSDAQHWWIMSTSKGYLIRPAHTDKVLDLKNNDTSDGSNIQLWSQNGNDAQYWSIYNQDDVQLTGPSFSVNAGTTTTPTQFSWNDVCGETAYDVKIWNGTIWEGDAYHVQWGVDGLSWSTTLPAGYYEAYVDAYNYFERKMSNKVSFSIRPKITVTAGTDTAKTKYSWGAMSGAKQYTVTIHSGSSGKDQTFQTTGTSGFIALDAGDYTIKVAGYDGTHTLTSDTVSFTVKKHTHSYDSGKITTEPTCTKAGVKTYTCTICNETKTETIPAAGHSYELKNAVAAGCTTSGYTGDLICKTCGDVKEKGSTIAASGHSWSEWSVTKPATETEEGTEARTCSVCKAKEERSIPVQEHSHSFQFSKTVAPTCTAVGYDLYTCTCGAEEQRNQKAALGHSYELKNSAAASCTTPGYTGDLICKTCGDIGWKGTELAASGHNWGEWSVTKPATETEEGTEARTCSVCKTKEERSIPVLEHSHSFQFSKTIAPTCTTGGYDLYTCTCGAEEQRNQTSALGHSYELKNAISPTCTTPGYTGNSICSVCGDIESVGSSIPAVGHSWGEWVTETPAKYLQTGTQTRSCKTCGAVETQELATLPSPFVDVQNPDFYYYNSILWALDYNVTNGMDATHFAPDRSCTRGQIVTFLWRAAGSPEPSSNYNPFTDVTGGPYYKAILWAVENGITKGITAATFAPNAPCTRGQIVTFIYRAAGEPQLENTSNPFEDVKGGAYYNAILWAVENGITKGTSATKFTPNATCTRGQGVTFLYRGRDLLQY